MKKAILPQEEVGSFRLINYIFINGKKIKVCCEAYQTKKGDSIKEVSWAPGKKDPEEKFTPLEAGYHLKFHTVSLPPKMSENEFKNLAGQLGLKLCKETRDDKMYILEEKFVTGMRLEDAAIVAARWFKKHQPIKGFSVLENANDGHIVSKHEGSPKS